MTELLRMPLDPLPVLICEALMALLFAHAAVVKFTDRSLFEQHLAAYGVPVRLVTPLAIALPGAEALVVLALLSPWRALGGVLAFALLLVYGMAMAWQRLQRRTLDCGCGGAPLPVSWWLVMRNVVLAALALLAAAPFAGRGLGFVDAAITAAAVALATLLYAAFNQVLRQFARLDTIAASR